MKINFNWELKGLDGRPMQNGNAGKALAQALAQQNQGNSIKLHDWALKLWNNSALEIDDTDADVLVALIERTESLTILAKAPMIEYLKKVKEKSDKK